MSRRGAGGRPRQQGVRGHLVRRDERGAETLEFVALLPVLVMVLLIAWQGLILLREQSEAEDDARLLARQAVLCRGGQAVDTLAAIDTGATGGTASIDSSRAPIVAVKVTLPPQSVLGPVDLASMGFPHPVATVTMRREPC